MKRAKLSWDVFDHVLVSFATAGAFADEDWQELVKAVKEPRVSLFISATSGVTEANSVQRKALIEVFKQKRMPAIIITDEGMVRGMVTAASWLGADVKAFSWEALQDVGKHIGASVATTEKIVEALKLFRAANPRA
jgi:hypothetical protein